MTRLAIGLFLITLLCWLSLFGLKPRLHKETWRGVKQLVIAITFSCIFVAAVSFIFSIIGK